jgi:large subunit ribosomal protein L1
MPNPKAGCVVPPNANLAPLVEKLKKTVRIKLDASPIYQTFVGTEDLEDEKIADLK